jgi:hypothetical protein
MTNENGNGGGGSTRTRRGKRGGRGRSKRTVATRGVSTNSGTLLTGGGDYWHRKVAPLLAKYDAWNAEVCALEDLGALDFIIEHANTAIQQDRQLVRMRGGFVAPGIGGGKIPAFMANIANVRRAGKNVAAS